MQYRPIDNAHNQPGHSEASLQRSDVVPGLEVRQASDNGQGNQAQQERQVHLHDGRPLRRNGRSRQPEQVDVERGLKEGLAPLLRLGHCGRPDHEYGGVLSALSRFAQALNDGHEGVGHDGEAESSVAVLLDLVTACLIDGDYGPKGLYDADESLDYAVGIRDRYLLTGGSWTVGAAFFGRSSECQVRVMRYEREIVVFVKPVLSVDSAVFGDRFVSFGYLPLARYGWVIELPIY